MVQCSAMGCSNVVRLPAGAWALGPAFCSSCFLEGEGTKVSVSCLVQAGVKNAEPLDEEGSVADSPAVGDGASP